MKLINQKANRLKSQSLVYALVVMAVVFSLAAGFLTFSRTAYQINKVGLDSQQAYYLAKSGIEIALYNLQTSFDTYTGTPNPLVFAGGAITISVGPKDPQTGKRQVTSAGTFNYTSQQIIRNYVKQLTQDGCWVADTWHNQVKELDSTGKILKKVDGFSLPFSVSVNPTDGSCWVADSHNHEVKKLNSEGEIIKTIPDFGEPWSVSVNPTDGSCWVADWTQNQVKKLNSEGKIIKTRDGFYWLQSISSPASVSMIVETSD